MDTQNTAITLADTIGDLSARLDNAERRASAAEGQYQRAENRYQKAEKRFRVLCGTLLGALAVTISLPFVSPAVAQGYGMTLAQAATRITALETKTASMSVVAASDAANTSGQPTVRFSGVNVQVVNGSGATENTNNGTGNLIVGYNELRGGNGGSGIRTGSHNLVIGTQNDYSASCGAVFGNYNNISSNYASVLSGFQNTASGLYAIVLSGQYNSASGSYASVSGGRSNSAENVGSSVFGGYANLASGQDSSVSGGRVNTASGNYSSVSGGFLRSAPNDYNWVAGTQAVQ